MGKHVGVGVGWVGGGGAWCGTLWRQQCCRVHNGESNKSAADLVELQQNKGMPSRKVRVHTTYLHPSAVAVSWLA